MPSRRWGRELAALVAEQAEELAREERTAKLPRHRGEVRFSELPLDVLDGIGRPAPPRQWALYLAGQDAHQWDAANHMSSAFLVDPHDPHAADHILDHFRTRACPIVCPVCLGRPLPRGWYCLGCDAAGLDDLAEDPAHQFEYRGHDVDQFPDWNYRQQSKLSVTSYAPSKGKLKGGKGA